jgi:PadR family transcriptional regulator, regulatory protein PadR
MSEPWATQFRKGIAELIILGALRDTESYGYELVSRLREIPALSLNGATVYPILARLEAARHLAVDERPSDNGPPRRYYRLTAAGSERLALLAQHWAGARDAIDALLGDTTNEKEGHHGHHR